MKKLKKLPNTFFEQKTLTAARQLLGKYLVRKIGTSIIREKITEVEAYVGPHDLACHSSKGRTARTETMYEKGGTIYVYLIYGVYWMLNIVTESKGFPSGILIRGTEHYKGPGIVAKNLHVDKTLKGKMLGTKTGLWIEEEVPKSSHVKKFKIIRGPRVGVAYAGAIWAAKPYRFILKP